MSLTPTQITELDRLEKIIENDKAAFIRCGQAVLSIREQKLYLRDYSTFEGYCQGRWGWGVDRAHQLMKAAKFWEKEKLLVETGAKKDSPILHAVNERQARAAMPTTGRSLDTTPSDNKENLPPAKPPVPLDKTGTKIPPPALPFWERREEVQPWLNVLSEIKCAIEKALKEGDAMFAWNGNPAIGYLTNAYAAIANSKPYAVCTDCQGWFTKVKAGGCSTCHNTGFLSKHQYDVCSRSEVKAIREKAAAMRQ